jgi:predicted nuclease of predicted toxin-antitoxin system
MRIYLDDDSAMPLLARLLKQAGHDVVLPADVDMSGAEDPVHLTFAIREQRVLIAGNYGDFEDLHDLLMQGRGHHPGIIVVRRDNDPRRDLTPRGIVHAIANLVATIVPLADQFVILNHWR